MGIVPRRFFESLSVAILGYLGFSIVRVQTARKAILFDKLNKALDLWSFAPPIVAYYILQGIKRSNSAQQQDLLAEFISQFSLNSGQKWFVEFGAAAWKEGNNTFLLETNSWKGILAEPSKYWQKELLRNRVCQIDYRCVSTTSGEYVSFFESVNPFLSTQSNLIDEDFNRSRRKLKSSYLVKTVSLEHLLVSHDSPKFIDYMSIDTEGNEFDILESFFPNSNFSIGFLTVEHNYTHNKNKIYDLLTNFGYVRILEAVSKHEDWYLLPSAYKPELLEVIV